MRRRDVILRTPVTVSNGVDCWQRLVHTLREASTGKFVVTVHNGQVVNIARIDKEVRITEMPHPKDTVPGP